MYPKKPPSRLGGSIEFIAHYLTCSQNKVLEPYGVTAQQAKVLIHLIKCCEQPITQKSLETMFLRRGSTVTNILTILEKKGLIERCTDPDDARVKLIKVTKKAHDLDEQLYKSVSQTEQELFACLEKDEAAATVNALNKIIDNYIIPQYEQRSK